MSNARVLLHVIALVGTLLVTFLGGAFITHNGNGVVSAAGLSAVCATQLACLIYWPWIERRAWRGASGWPVGIMIAAGSHVLCALGFLLPGMLGPGFVFGQALLMGMLVFGFSLLLVGWLSFPLTMIVAQWVVRLRNRELHDVVV